MSEHPDDLAVDRFATAMKSKLAQKRKDGRGGWEDKAQCSADFLSQLLREHVEKGDPLDVGNLAMMLHQRGERITETIAAPVQVWTSANDEQKSLGWTYDLTDTEAIRDQAEKDSGYGATLEFTEAVMKIAAQRIRSALVAAPVQVHPENLIERLEEQAEICQLAPLKSLLLETAAALHEANLAIDDADKSRRTSERERNEAVNALSHVQASVPVAAPVQDDVVLNVLKSLEWMDRKGGLGLDVHREIGISIRALRLISGDTSNG